MMYARVVSARVAPEQLDDLIRMLQEDVLPNAETQPGFEGAVTLSDPGTGKGMMITFWATPEDLIAGEVTGYLGRQLAAVAPMLRGPTTRETFHVDIRR
jgi:heme-degrading monooxygenase HmoA